MTRVLAPSFLGYALLFLLVHRWLGDGALMLVVVPVLASAALGGFRAGLAAGALALPVNLSLSLALGGPWGIEGIGGHPGLAAHACLLLAATGLGCVQDSRARTRRLSSALRAVERARHFEAGRDEALVRSAEVTSGLALGLSGAAARVVSSARQAQARLATGDSEAAATHIADVLERAERMRQVLTGLEIFARVRTAGSAGSVDLESALRAAVLRVGELRRDAPAILVDRAPVPMLRGDPAGVGQVVSHLLLYAVDLHAAAGGKEPIQCSVYPGDGDGVILEVSIPGAEGSHADEIAAEGALGLAVASGIAAILGGEIEVAAGDRTVSARLRLPAAEASMAAGA